MTKMNESPRVTCSLIPRDWFSLRHFPDTDTFSLWSENTPNDTVTATEVFATRAQMHELHGWLTETLGLTHPRPSAPKTASIAHRHDPYAFDVVQARLGDPDE